MVNIELTNEKLHDLFCMAKYAEAESRSANEVYVVVSFGMRDVQLRTAMHRQKHDIFN